MANPPEMSHTAGGAVDLGRVAALLTQVSEKLRDNPDELLPQAVVDVALEMIPAARWSSLTVLRHGQFTSLSSSDDTARRIDAVQYEIGSGPCLDSFLYGTTNVVTDMRTDARWPEFAARVVPEGVRSVLVHALHLTGDAHAVAALNVYSDKVDAFDEESLWAGAMLATHGALGVSLALSHQKQQDLEKAIRSNREIGTAVGVLMVRHSVTQDQAFDLLRLVSQDTNRKLVDIASEVALTGELGLAPRGAPPRGTAPRG